MRVRTPARERQRRVAAQAPSPGARRGKAVRPQPPDKRGRLATAVWVLAHGEFESFGESLWWAAQTVTTVGYGDVIPQTPFSKVIAVFVMFFGVAAVSITTAIVTSALMASAQRRLADAEPQDDPHREILERIEQRLEALEQRLP